MAAGQLPALSRQSHGGRSGAWTRSSTVGPTARSAATTKQGGQGEAKPQAAERERGIDLDGEFELARAFWLRAAAWLAAARPSSAWREVERTERGLRVDFFGERAVLIDVGDGDFGAGDDGDPDRGDDDRCGSAAQRDAPHDLVGRHSQQGVFFELGFDRAQAGGDDQGDPGDGGHGVNPDGAAPAAEPGFVGEVGIGGQACASLGCRSRRPKRRPSM